MNVRCILKKSIAKSIILTGPAICLVALASGNLHAQRKHYTPPALVMPLHAQRNQLHTSLGIGRGVDINLSYALSDHLAVFATGTLHNGWSRNRSLLAGMLGGHPSYYKKDNQALAGGLGYFWRPDANSSKRFETYVGAGKFYVDVYRESEKGTGYFISSVQTGYWSLFWQLSSGRKVKKSEMAAAVRISYSNYDDLYHKDQGGMYKPSVTEGLWGMHIDPALSYSYLWRSFKFNGQLGFSWPLFKVAAKETRTEYFLGEEIVTTEVERQSVGLAGLARLSVQYTFDLNHKADK